MIAAEIIDISTGIAVVKCLERKLIRIVSIVCAVTGGGVADTFTAAIDLRDRTIFTAATAPCPASTALVNFAIGATGYVPFAGSTAVIINAGLLDAWLDADATVNVSGSGTLALDVSAPNTSWVVYETRDPIRRLTPRSRSGRMKALRA